MHSVGTLIEYLLHRFVYHEVAVIKDLHGCIIRARATLLERTCWTDRDRSLPVPARPDGEPGSRPGNGAMKAAVEADFHFAKAYATGRSGIEMCLAVSSINALTKGETWRLVGYTA